MEVQTIKAHKSKKKESPEKKAKPEKLSPDIPEKEYRSLEHLGSTDLSLILDNTRKFNLMRTGAYSEDRTCFEFGKAFHYALLEPNKVFEMVAVADAVNLNLKKVAERNNFIEVDCRGKTAKAYKQAVENFPDCDVLIEQEAEQVLFFQQNEGRVFVTTKEFNVIQRLVEKARAVPGFEGYLSEGKKEQAFFGEINGVPVKGRMDVIFKNPDGTYYVFDPKQTSMEATEKTFSKMSADHNYYVQEWLYTEILRQNGLIAKDYLFLLVSQLDYSGAGYYKHDYVAMERAQELAEKAVEKFKACSETGDWGEGKFDFNKRQFSLVNEITLPNYIFYKYE